MYFSQTSHSFIQRVFRVGDRRFSTRLHSESRKGGCLMLCELDARLVRTVRAELSRVLPGALIFGWEYYDQKCQGKRRKEEWPEMLPRQASAHIGAPSLAILWPCLQALETTVLSLTPAWFEQIHSTCEDVERHERGLAVHTAAARGDRLEAQIGATIKKLTALITAHWNAVQLSSSIRPGEPLLMKHRKAIMAPQVGRVRCTSAFALGLCFAIHQLSISGRKALVELVEQANPLNS